jgi:tetratricopeptide (TPR) repeat protein
VRKASTNPATSAARAARTGRASAPRTDRAASGSSARAKPGRDERSRSPGPRAAKRSGAKEGRGRAAAPRPHATLSAEDILQRAIGATTPRARRLWARRGLSLRSALDRTTQSLLLRQLYLSYYEDRRFDKASQISEQLVALDVLPDVAQQDAARAKQALGDVDGAASHLRLAARVGPASRRAFHFWTLGSLYFLAHRYAEAVAALTRAARWGTTDKPLYQAHLALALCAEGKPVEDLESVIDRLADAPAVQGYGRFILGHLLVHANRPTEAKRHLEAFVRRTTTGRTALAIALDGEVVRARETLADLQRNRLAT